MRVVLGSTAVRPTRPLDGAPLIRSTGRTLGILFNGVAERIAEHRPLALLPRLVHGTQPQQSPWTSVALSSTFGRPQPEGGVADCRAGTGMGIGPHGAVGRVLNDPAQAAWKISRPEVVPSRLMWARAAR